MRDASVFLQFKIVHALFMLTHGLRSTLTLGLRDVRTVLVDSSLLLGIGNVVSQANGSGEFGVAAAVRRD